MTSNVKLAVAMASFAGVLLVLSLGWWWLVFGNVVASGYISSAQAATCLAADTDLCRLAQALCTNSHVFEIRWYAPEVLWAAAALLVLALIQSGARPRLR
ncbi:hypothetical protein [Sinorhizobium chiapasense]|uniref:Transmembrane protein n=1 Tax=Sinorhizobium chiapasense TaxID=501572 RepID=A0ABZ2BHT9_9HYPH